MRMLGLPGLVWTAWTAIAPPAHADAFLERPGEGKVILLTGFDTADRYWTRDGRLMPIAQYSKFSLTALTEYGLDSATTLLARVEAGRLQDMGGVEGQGAGAIGARRLLLDAGALRIAAQAVLSAGSGLEGMPTRATGAALDARLAGAITFSLAGKPAFLEASAGPRFATGDWRGARLDLSFGVRPAANWLLLLQNFNRFNEQSPFGGRARAHKAQASVIHDFSERWSVMAGAFTTIAARAERRQSGALTGVIRRF
ncbi:MAG: hypothetical protein K2Y29_07505 [Beijerinckiaceae bacterium]|nr:hypothetical protein [Beijerinckiaceae bacterium]